MFARPQCLSLLGVGGLAAVGACGGGERMSESEEDLLDSQDCAYDSDDSDEGYGDDGGFESVLVRQRTQAEWQVCAESDGAAWAVA